jgi:hypothetical protein
MKMKVRELIKALLNYNLDAEVELEVERPNDDYKYIYADANDVYCTAEEGKIIISEVGNEDAE